MLQKEFLEIPSQTRLEIKQRKLRWKDDVYILHTIQKNMLFIRQKKYFVINTLLDSYSLLRGKWII